MTMVKNQYGAELDFDAANAIMDEEICDELNRDADVCESEQTFFDAYCAAHKAKYGEEFEPNKEHGEW